MTALRAFILFLVLLIGFLLGGTIVAQILWKW